MALINGKVLLQDFVCGFVVIFAMVVCFVSISFEKTILVEFDSLFMNYISMAQNLFWIIGLCSFGIGSFMIFISSDGFLKLLDAVKYNSDY